MASSAVSSRGRQHVKRSAADAEPEAIAVPMEMGNDTRVALPSALEANIRRRITNKSLPEAIITQEGIDWYRHQQ